MEGSHLCSVNDKTCLKSKASAAGINWDKNSKCVTNSFSPTKIDPDSANHLLDAEKNIWMLYAN